MVNYRLQAHILEVVDNQINDRDPAFVYQTLNRLMKEGFPIDEAKKLIASVLLEEMYNIMKDQKEFNEEVYENNLSKLPDYYYEQLDIENDPSFEPEEGDMTVEVQKPFVRQEKVKRNDPCTCGSGRKFKKCCG